MEHENRRHEGLMQAEERMRSVVNHVVDGIISIDEGGTVTTFNPAAERIFGYRAAEVIGRNLNLLMPEPFRGEHDGYIASYLATGHAKIIGIGREVIGKRKDGSTFPMDLAISTFHLGGARHFTGIVRDITERKRTEGELRHAEERMRSVVDHVIDGIITIDTQGTVQSFNRAAEKLFGYPSDAVVGRNVSMLMPQPYRGEHDGYLANYLATGQAKIIGIGREVIGRRRDGSTFPMELAVSEFQIEARRYFTGIVRDITERKRLEHELRRRVEDLAEADRQKNEFLAMLAHELRNPLAPMRNALHLLKVASADADVSRDARDILERQMQHLVRLVDDLLDVSRIVRGKITLRIETIDVSQAVARAVETARPLIEAQGHDFALHLPDEPVQVNADLVLLLNAAKYTEPGGRISLTVERDRDEAVMRVRDTGVGIAPEALSHIFDVFYQGDQSLARSQGGLGIGLTLVRRLVQMHGGSVSASSAGPGCGSEFTIRLAWAAPAPPAKAGAVAADPGAAPRGSGDRRLPVFEDNVDAARSIAAILRLSGHDVRCAHDGIAALETASSYEPDLVILDIGLPMMSGYEVARRLREQPRFRHTRLVAVTGYGQEEDRRRTDEAGFDFHLTKPIDPDALQALVAEPEVARRPSARPVS
jgi:PAS domain S-box-containing protein